MLAALYSIRRVSGAEVLAAGALICAVIYLAVSFLVSGSRTKKGKCTVLLALLCAELTCDAAWFLLYFPGGEYHNYGIGGVYGAALWPILLLIAGGAAAAINSGRET